MSQVRILPGPRIGADGVGRPCRESQLGSRDATNHRPRPSRQRVDVRRAHLPAGARARPTRASTAASRARHALRAMPVGPYVRHDGADHRGIARCPAPCGLGPHDGPEAPAGTEGRRATHPGMRCRRRPAAGRPVRDAGAVRTPPGGSAGGAQTIAPMMRRRNAAKLVAVRAMTAATT